MNKLTKREQEKYERLLLLINNYCYNKEAREEVIEAVDEARKATVKEIISVMKTMIINRRAEERSGLNLIYTTYSPERLLNNISDYVRIAMNVEVE